MRFLGGATMNSKAASAANKAADYILGKEAAQRAA